MISNSHPAKFSDNILGLIRLLVVPGARVLDPMGGVGRLREVCPEAVINEIEWEWASQCGRPALQSDALVMPFADGTFDVVVTSCTYGNRMADHHEAKDGSRRYTYRHSLGRGLHPNNSGRLQWGEQYRKFHVEAWVEAQRVLKTGGWFILNTSNHIRKGAEVDVTGWHRQTLEDLGFTYAMGFDIDTHRLRHGANNRLRVSKETVAVFDR